MSNSIVTVKVNQIIAPAPSVLQETGAFISQGGTTTAANTLTLLTSLSSLATILTAPVTISTITWLSQVVTVTCTGAHGIPNGDVVQIVIAGCSPAGYNGTFTGTSTGADTVTYPLTTNPGSASIEGTLLLYSAQELAAMNATFFAQGSNLSVYVLELGCAGAAAGITSLTTYLASPSIPIYSYLVPREWGTLSAMVTLAGNYESDTSQVYFWVTTTLADITLWAALKSVNFWVEASNIPITEFSAAADFYNTLNYDPSPVNKVTPNAFSYLQGVTAYNGTAANMASIKAAYGNYVGTGAEGGISNTLTMWGTNADGNDFTYWYSVDWVQINVNLALSNAVINGSNNPANPLYYNQAGINSLQQVAQGVMNTGIAVGLVLAPVTVDAVSFVTYIAEEPTNYAAGIYGGLSVEYTPARGFTSIIFNVTVSSFPTG